MTPDVPPVRDRRDRRARRDPLSAPLAALAGAALLAAGGLAGCDGEAGGDGDAASGAFYRGETVEVIVPYGAGGGADTWARLIAPALERHLADGASLQVVNVPGASSIAGANQFVQRRPHDGLNALVSSGSTFFAYLLGEPMVEYDFRDMAPILASPVGGVVFADPELGVSDPGQLGGLDRSLTYGGISAAGNDLLAILSFDLLDLEVETVLGYETKATSLLAFQQGETDIEYQTMPGYMTGVRPLVEEDEAVPLYSFGILDEDGQVVRDPAVPELPSVREAYVAVHGEEPSGVVWEAYRAALASGIAMSKVLWLHGDAPPPAIEELRAAAREAVGDSSFRASAREVIGDYPFYVGEEVSTNRSAAVDVSPEALSWLRRMLADRYGLDRLTRSTR